MQLLVYTQAFAPPQCFRFGCGHCQGIYEGLNITNFLCLLHTIRARAFSAWPRKCPFLISTLSKFLFRCGLVFLMGGHYIGCLKAFNDRHKVYLGSHSTLRNSPAFACVKPSWWLGLHHVVGRVADVWPSSISNPQE